MILISKDVWIAKEHIVKVKKVGDTTKIYLADDTVEVLDVSVLTLEQLIRMLEGG